MMKHSIKINSFKDITKIVLLFFVISLHGDFVSEGISSVTIPEFKPIIFKPAQPIHNGVLEKVSFQVPKHDGTQETITRYGELLIRKDAKATILICHGYMCDKNDVAFIRTIFSRYNVMTFDFRAHGENIDRHQCCTFGKHEALDVIAAARYAKSRSEINHLPLVAYGFSMGAVSAIEAQSLDNSLFTGMILDCPFDSSDNIIRKALNEVKFSLLGFEFSLPGRTYLHRFAYNHYVQSMVKVMLKTIAKFDALQTKTRIMPVSPVVSIEKVNVPCYFITCKNDEKVPVQAVTAVYAGAQGYKRLWITNGRRHFDSFFYNPEVYSGIVNTFIKKVVSKELEQDRSAKVLADPDIS